MKFIKCTRQGCDGFMRSQGGGIRGGKRTYECVKCGHLEVFDGAYIDAKIDWPIK